MKKWKSSLLYPAFFVKIVLTLLVLSGCTRSEQISEPEFSCDINIPYVTFDSVSYTIQKTTFVLTDTFELVDWYYGDELILFLLNEGCLSFPIDSDSMESWFWHDSRKAVGRLTFSELKSFVNTRVYCKSYYTFFSSNVEDENFRSSLRLLSHFYGKAISGDPKDGVMYHGNVLEFLVKTACDCEQGKMKPEDLELIEKINAQLIDQTKGVDKLKKLHESLEEFVKNCKVGVERG